MARVQVVSDDGRTVLDVIDATGESDTVARCRNCGESFSDRGHFEDTVRVAEVHAEQCLRGN